MMSLGRLMLLGCCAATGVAIALAVGLSAAPPSRETVLEQGAGSGEQGAETQTRSASEGLSSRSEEPTQPVRNAEQRARGGEAQEIAASDDQPEPPEDLPAAQDGSATDSASRVSPSGPVAPDAPVPAEPNPLVAADADPPPEADHSPEPKSLPESDRFQKALDYLQQQLAPTSASPPPQPAPTTIPEIGPLNPPDPHSAGEARKRITRSVAGEGDEQLAIHIQEADIREVLEMLSEQGNLNILASNRVQGKVSATLKGVDIDSALDAILRSTGFVARREGKFIYVGTPEDFENMAQLLDVVGTRVYRPNYLTATDLQTLIMPLLTPKIGVCSISAPSEIGIGSDDDQVGGNKFAGVDVVLVRDYEAVLAQVDQVVAEVDVRPMQIAIEAMILSVRLSDTDKFGVNFELLGNRNNVKLGWGTPLENLGNLEFTDGGLRFGVLDSSVGAFLDALETVGDTNVIATPRLMVLNKHRADILIGKEEGYVSTTQTETARTQSVEFLEIGAQLRIRPFVSPDGLIRMEVHPELSDGSVRELAGFTVPRKDVTKVTTNIMVRDGCTAVIGGLVREQLETTTRQVPLLGNLPVVGVAFRNVDEKIIREEVVVLITPRIVYEPETCCEGQKAACEFQRRQGVYADKMSPLGKRSIGRRYYRLAQQAWQAGDCARAQRFADLAVHFDPLSLEAVDLRNRIWRDEPRAAQAIQQPMVEGPLDVPAGTVMAPPTVLESLPNAPLPPGPPLHPRDPGMQGTYRDIVRPGRLP